MVTIQHSADNIVENMRIFRIFSTFQQNLRSKRAWDRISNDIWFYIFCCIKAGLCVWTPAVHTAAYLNQVTKSFCVGSNLGLWSGLNTFSHSPQIQHVIQSSQLSHLTRWTCSILEKGGWLHPDFGFIMREQESRNQTYDTAGFNLIRWNQLSHSNPTQCECPYMQSIHYLLENLWILTTEPSISCSYKWGVQESNLWHFTWSLLSPSMMKICESCQQSISCSYKWRVQESNLWHLTWSRLSTSVMSWRAVHPLFIGVNFKT